MYEKILVPLDGSNSAEVALPYAEELAGRLGSEITLVNVVEEAEAPFRQMHHFYIKKVALLTKDSAVKSLGESVAKEIEVKSVTLKGNPAGAIIDYANKENIGLIIMATHGQTGVKRWALGGVADKLVRASICPIALIRAKGGRPLVRKKGILKKVLVPLDGSKESEAVIPYVEELASRLKAEVTLFQMLELDHIIYSETQVKLLESARASAKDYIENAATQLQQKGVSVKTETKDMLGSTMFAEEIIKLADQLNVDLVMMSTHGRSGVSRWAFGSVTEKVLRAGNTPLLLVRAPGAVTE